MSNEETICAFMEPKPRHKPVGCMKQYHWWIYRAMTHPYWFPVPLTLDRLHEVEERLTDEQWSNYANALVDTFHQRFPRFAEVIHATAAQKITALAAVLESHAKEKGVSKS